MPVVWSTTNQPYEAAALSDHGSASPAVQPRVCVLMSTFNGERFLVDQLESLVAQADVELLVLIRDDGSTDGTRQLLDSYAKTHRIVSVHPGAHVGVVGSFLELTRLAPQEGGWLFAFCDQDDVWLPGKLSRAARRLEVHSPIPQMYCSAVQFVDEGLRPIGMSRKHRRPAFANALVENIAPGCTMVFNEAARALVVSALPRNVLMHDWWLYLVVSAFGVVVFESEPGIYYRQHAGNAIGGTPSFVRVTLRRLRRFRRRRSEVFQCSDQAEEFLRCHGARCPASARRLAEEMLAVKPECVRRVKFGFSGRVHRNSGLDNVLLKMLIALGRY